MSSRIFAFVVALTAAVAAAAVAAAAAAAATPRSDVAPPAGAIVHADSVTDARRGTTRSSSR
jgi:Spy/CpxP family protein refolding chaperone